MRTAKSGVDIIRFLSKFQNILFFVRIVAVYFLEKIENYYVFKLVDQNLRSFSILLRFQNETYFCNQYDRPIPKIYTFVSLSVHLRIKKFYFSFKQKRQYLYI